MISAKSLHRQATQTQKKTGQIHGKRHTPPANASILVKPSQRGLESSAESTNELSNGDYLLKAVISAQKTTIAGFQSDIEDATAKIRKLKGKCAQMARLAVKQTDHDLLQAQCRSDYEAGVAHEQE